MTVVDEPAVLIHLHLSDTTPAVEEEITLADGNKAKVLWKDVLVEGEYPMSPGATGATTQKMTVIAEGESDPATKTIAMSDLIQSHKDGAFKYVTIPTTHKDGVLDNTGYVVRPDGLRVVDKNDKKVMQAALGFTEPDVKGKVQRGTIPDVSAGIFFNWVNKHTAKRFKAAMKHVALTPTPFMGNLDPFPAIFASDGEDYADIPNDTKLGEVYNFADAEFFDTSGDTEDKVEIVWNEKDGANFLRSKLEEALSPDPRPVDDSRPYVPQPSYYVQDVSPAKSLGLVEEYFKGDRTRYVVPFTVDDGDVKASPSTRWVEVREAMVAASDNFEEVASTTLREKLGLALSEQIGDKDVVYRVEDVSLDNRARITCNAKGQAWVANFALLSNGTVWVEPADKWEPITKKDDAKRPASSGTSSVALSDEDARVQAARQRRRQMMSSTTHSTQKEV
jgi:hypothetical protein